MINNQAFVKKIDEAIERLKTLYKTKQFNWGDNTDEDFIEFIENDLDDERSLYKILSNLVEAYYGEEGNKEPFVRYKEKGGKKYLKYTYYGYMHGEARPIYVDNSRIPYGYDVESNDYDYFKDQAKKHIPNIDVDFVDTEVDPDRVYFSVTVEFELD